MKPRPLVTNKKYLGKYVAMQSFNKKKVIASGKDPDGVIERAKRKGFVSPVVFFVPNRDTLNIY